MTEQQRTKLLKDLRPGTRLVYVGSGIETKQKNILTGSPCYKVRNGRKGHRNNRSHQILVSIAGGALWFINCERLTHPAIEVYNRLTKTTEK